jgi:hypothetical protein
MKKIEEETEIIVQLPSDYDVVMGKGVTRFDQE